MTNTSLMSEWKNCPYIYQVTHKNRGNGFDAVKYNTVFISTIG